MGVDQRIAIALSDALVGERIWRLGQHNTIRRGQTGG